MKEEDNSSVSWRVKKKSISIREPGFLWLLNPRLQLQDKVRMRREGLHMERSRPFLSLGVNESYVSYPTLFPSFIPFFHFLAFLSIHPHPSISNPLNPSPTPPLTPTNHPPPDPPHRPPPSRLHLPNLHRLLNANNIPHVLLILLILGDSLEIRRSARYERSHRG